MSGEDDGRASDLYQKPAVNRDRLMDPTPQGVFYASNIEASQVTAFTMIRALDSLFRDDLDIPKEVKSVVDEIVKDLLRMSPSIKGTRAVTIAESISMTEKVAETMPKDGQANPV